MVSKSVNKALSQGPISLLGRVQARMWHTNDCVTSYCTQRKRKCVLAYCKPFLWLSNLEDPAHPNGKAFRWQRSFHAAFRGELVTSDSRLFACGTACDCLIMFVINLIAANVSAGNKYGYLYHIYGSGRSVVQLFSC